MRLAGSGSLRNRTLCLRTSNGPVVAACPHLNSCFLRAPWRSRRRPGP
jgi:hypothetical protein